jgi:hypothetical protein
LSLCRQVYQRPPVKFRCAHLFCSLVRPAYCSQLFAHHDTCAKSSRPCCMVAVLIVSEYICEHFSTVWVCALIPFRLQVQGSRQLRSPDERTDATRKNFGILIICMFGPNLPIEKHRHADRLQVWNNAAKYAMNMNSIKLVLEWRDQKALVNYMLLTTGPLPWSVSARTCPTVPAFFGQQTVFSGIRAPETQLNLPTESVMEP